MSHNRIENGTLELRRDKSRLVRALIKRERVARAPTQARRSVLIRTLLTNDSRLAEGFGAVAGFAFRPEFASVDIVFRMARAARPARLHPVVGCLRMAAAASKPLVLARQRKPRLRVVIIIPVRPSIRIMATPAVRPKRTFVLVVFLVAADAACRCLAICACQMALFAGRLGVHPDQWKAGQIVVERHF